jgi:hypothetical protein
LQQSNARLFRLHTAAPLNGGFISGCGATETSADAFIEGRYNGAMTYYLLRELQADARTPLTTLGHRLVEDLRRGGYTQTPQVKGSGDVIARPFMAIPSVYSLGAISSRAFELSPSARAADTRENKQNAIINVSGGSLTLKFKDISVSDLTDLEKLLDTLTPHFANALLEAKKSRDSKEWSVGVSATTTQGPTTVTGSGTYIQRDWSASVSGSTNIGGATVTGTASIGTPGTSGTVTVGATF